MRTRKRNILCLLVTVLCLSIFSAHAEEPSLTLMGLERDGSGRNWSESNFFERIGERTGVSFAFRQYDDEAAYAAVLTEVLAGEGDLPDVLFKASLSPEQEMDALQSGLLIDLAPLLSEHAPNLAAILDARPDFRAAITQPNGAIASLPAINGAPRQCAIWLNKSWMAELGVPMPDTIDAMTEALRTFRDSDPNGNGKQDEIPLYFVGTFEAKFLLHAFGLTPNDYNIYVEGDSVRYAPFEPGFRAFVEWLSMAHNEGLIDKNAFRQMHPQTTSSTEENPPVTIGGMITIAPYTVVDMEKTTDYTVVPPLAYNGTQQYRRLIGSITRGTFAITRACEDVPAALRFVDALYTEAGGRLAFAGLEGEDYTLAQDGSWAWNYDDDYLTLSSKIAESIISGDSLTPGLEPVAFMRNSEITDDNYARAQIDVLTQYLVDPFPLTWPTDREREARIAELQAALGACVDTAIANFAMGIVELTDESYAAFEAELRALGAEELVSLFQQTLKEANQ